MSQIQDSRDESDPAPSGTDSPAVDPAVPDPEGARPSEQSASEGGASATEGGTEAASSTPEVAKKPKRRKGKKRSSDEKKSATSDLPPPEERRVDADDDLPPDLTAQPLPIGNPLRPVRGGIAMALGLFVAFCLMAVKTQWRFGVPVCALAIGVATFGLLDLIGSFDDPEDRVRKTFGLSDLAQPLALVGGGAFALWGLISLAVAGYLSTKAPVVVAAILIPASFMAIVLGLYQLGVRAGVYNGPGEVSPRPLLKRHGFWLILITTLIDLPLLGSHSLSDPWETHYGEVAREILARNDWISLWWAQDGWFWSKPILDFWIQALGMATFGVRYASGGVLSAVVEGRTPFPEWAVRLPVFLLTLLAVYLLYKAVANAFGRRAGLFGGIVLVTMPQWFLLTHQTMTDMPFVAPMAAAMACVLLGAHSDPEKEVRVYELNLGFATLRFSAYHLVIGAIVACALPQILYLFSRNVTLDIRGFHTHADAFAAGSPGNCTLPGNEACHGALPVYRGLQPSIQALVWAQALGLVLYLNWGERRIQRLFFLAAWLFAAISTMAKGPAGIGVPMICALAYIVVSNRYRDLLRLELTSGFFILLAVAMPWFVAMYVRHGQPFTDRLIFHDMFKRAFTHVHDTNDGDDVSFRFYIWQLGYATFPWTGLLPAALVYWMRRPEDEDRKGDASVLLVMWFVLAFAGFSLMLTKFHHYILPAVPPAAMLVGVLLDGLLKSAIDRPSETRKETTPRTLVDTLLYLAGLGAGIYTTLSGISRVVVVLRGTEFKASALAGAIGVVAVGIGAVVLTIAYLGHGAPPRMEDAEPGAVVPEQSFGYRDGPMVRASAKDGDQSESLERILLGAATMAGAMLVIPVGRDLFANYDGFFSQIRLIHLITYNYRRPWPTSLDFTGMFAAFTAVAALLMVGLSFVRVRRHVVIAFLVFGGIFGVWGLDVYFMRISPHWGQRETIMAYYEAIRSVPGPIIAYQMNWKGENFYTGNNVAAFVSSGRRFEDYLTDAKKKGTKTFYVVTEHSRVGSLQNELGSLRSFEKLTTADLDNKFILVRAQYE